MRSALRTVAWLLLSVPAVVLAQATITTFTLSTSKGFGPTNSVFIWSGPTLGPATIQIGDLGVCAIPPPPYPNCTPSSGSGTVADPFIVMCSAPLTLSGCTLPGQPFFVPAGTQNTGTHAHTQTVQVQVAPQPAPLDTWVSFGSALGIALLVLIWLRRRDGRGVDTRV